MTREAKREQLSISFVTVATGIYRTKYLKDLADSIVATYGTEGWQLVVMTDEPNDVHMFCESKGIKLGYIGSFTHNRWPEGSMLRYDSYSGIEESVFSESDYVVHLDADMLVRGKLLRQDLASITGSRVGLVLHPSFYRPGPLGFRVRFYLSNPRVFFSDAIKVLLIGGVGSWERNRASEAFVGRRFRREYFAGGVWITSPSYFSEFVKEIRDQVAKDLKKDIVATWHDESHLNHWAQRNQHRLVKLPPTYCFAHGYPAIDGSRALIEAVEKEGAGER